MERGKRAWAFAISLLLVLSIASLSLLEQSALHGVGFAFASFITPVTTTNMQADAHDDYLEPCIGCTPTEEDYENLTTFELLAKFPELSDDPISNETTTSNQTEEPPSLLTQEDTDAEELLGDSTSEQPRQLRDDSEDDVQLEDDMVLSEEEQENTDDSTESDAGREEEESDAEEEDCAPSYPDVCIPSPPPDLDCGDISEDGFEVRGSDPHRFDGDDDGIGCEG